MSGFFDIGNVVTTSTDYLCSNCRLDKGCLNPRMPLSGKGKLKTLIIAEAPGEEEDRLNKQLIGDVGQWLRKRLHKRGLDLDEDFWKTNSIICRPPKNREPSRNELVCCHPNIEKAIRENKPKFIWLFGGSAIESFYMNKFSNLTPSRWRGLCIPDYDIGAWVIPMFHPSYAHRNKENTLITSQFERDLDFAIKCIKTKGSIHNLARPDLDAIHILTDFDEVCDIMEDLIDDPPNRLFFDYETTGLKPYKKGHRIATVSFTSDKEISVYSFPLQYPHWTNLHLHQIEQRWKKVLLTNSKKVSHNMKFEDVWSRIILDTTPACWNWCTMLTAHILDNRRKFSGLKFQSFIRWGVPDYGKEIRPYLESEDKKGFNRIMEAPLNKLLLYGGTDSLLTKWLYNEQIKEIDDHLEKGVDLFTEGTLTLADIQINGINCDTEYYQNSHKELEQRIVDRLKELLQFEECKKFEEVTGYLPNLGSSDDLKQMFFDILGFKPPRITEKGNASVDKDALSRIDTPLAKEITELSRIKKIDNTYISQFLREIDPDGRIHPFFDLGRVLTYRSSSSDPNFQNVPVRNEEAKRYARSGILPSKGFQILDFDYKAIEVDMGACYTQDPVLIKYIEDPSTDMHRDTAADIFKLHPNKVTKDLRFYVKNGFVFPEWYGSYYKNCAINIWGTCKNLKTGDDLSVIDHLEEKGIIKRRAEAAEFFIEHVKRVEEKYWKKFKVFKQWQENWYKNYEKKGYIELLTGFRCLGYMGRNELINYPFQGTAFHCLLWSLIEINAQFREQKMDSKVIAQIHDNAIIDCCPDEHDEVKKLCTRIATQDIREAYPWIIVPLAIEWESTEIDGSWYAKKETNEEDN
jgi:uracil-DNA glycosylase family 4